MTHLSHLWRLSCLAVGLAVWGLTLSSSALAVAPVCMGAGLVCEDHYAETQSCGDDTEKPDVLCHKYGVCDAAGTTDQCSTGEASWCEGPCNGGKDAPAQPAWTTPLLTSDGVTLLTDLYATTLDPQPVLLLRTPWERSDLAGLATSLVEANEAMVLVQSVRGRGGSGGSDKFFGTAPQDGYDTMMAIEDLGLSSGIIATWGANDLATEQRLMGPGAPKIYGCQHTTSGFHDLATWLAWSGGVRRVEVDGWLEQRGLSHLSTEWGAHPEASDPYWDPLRLSDEEITEVRTTGLHRTGWYDIALEDTITYFQRLQASGGAGAKGNQWLVIGPWDYTGQYHAEDFPGVLEGSPESALDAAWRLQCLYGVAGQLDALKHVHVYVMGAIGDASAPGHIWRSFPTWPPVSEAIALYLAPEGEMVTEQAGDEEEVVSFQHDPEDPVPTLGGRNLTLASGPLDQAPLESREDVLVYSAEFPGPVEIIGPVVARLFLNSPPGVSQVVVRLTDVHPDGRSLLIASGIQRLEGAGLPVEVEVSLGPTAHHLAQGHGLRLSISGSSGQAFAIEPNLMTIHVALGPQSPSRLLLPVVSGLEVAPPPPDGGDEVGADAGGDATPDAGSSQDDGTEDAGRRPIEWDLGAPRGEPPGEVLQASDAGPGLVSVPQRDEGCGGAPGDAVWALGLLGLGVVSRRLRLSRA